MLRPPLVMCPYSQSPLSLLAVPTVLTRDPHCPYSRSPLSLLAIPTVLTRNPQHPSPCYSAIHSLCSDIRCPYSQSPPSLLDFPTVLTRSPHRPCLISPPSLLGIPHCHHATAIAGMEKPCH
ncbi:hypothetical protein BDN67DRAFT_659159 [Paxillus ammoniavirescens]|nr:hypothetical protein BDN67DRAFT_659159 [Paxillus ammoniavirescens]